MLNLVVSPDGRIVIASHSGYLPHGIDVFDVKTQKQIQHIELKTTWLGMTWSPDGHTLYVSGGNATGAKKIEQTAAPIYEFSYKDGRLSDQPKVSLLETADPSTVWWSGVAYLPSRHWLYAANRGTGPGPSNVVSFRSEDARHTHPHPGGDQPLSAGAHTRRKEAVRFKLVERIRERDRHGY